MTQITVLFYDEATDTEKSVTVSFDYTPACKGARERKTGVPLEPDCVEDIEITGITDSEGNFLEVSPKERNILENRCKQEVQIEQASFTAGY